MGFAIGTLGRVVVFGSVAPILGMGAAVAGLAGYGLYCLVKD